MIVARVLGTGAGSGVVSRGRRARRALSTGRVSAPRPAFASARLRAPSVFSTTTCSGAPVSVSPPARSGGGGPAASRLRSR